MTLKHGLLVAAACAAIACSSAYATTKAEYTSAKEHADADYKVAEGQCANLAGNPKDICKAEAKASQTKAKAAAEADYKNTDGARKDAAIAAADADYDVAKQRCDAKTGNEKDVCVKEAKAAQTRMVADAKATNQSRSARKDAMADKTDAEYDVAIQKCDGFSGTAKDDCRRSTKARFGK
jgi:hypothetical protein